MSLKQRGALGGLSVAAFKAVPNAVAWPVNLLFSIPIVGYICFLSLVAIQHAVASLFLAPEMLLCLLRLMPEKRLRIRVIILQDRYGTPICEQATIDKFIRMAVVCFKQYANIRIEPVPHFSITRDRVPALTEVSQFTIVDRSASMNYLLDCECGRFQPLGLPRILINTKLSMHCFWNGWRRIIGYGGPICIFAVRGINNKSMQTSAIGWCRMGFDYVLLCPSKAKSEPSFNALAHELGHACMLRHVNQPNNLMNPILFSERPSLTIAQIVRLRLSPHVTYL